MSRARRSRRRRHSLRSLLVRLRYAAAAVLDPTMPRDLAERCLRELVAEVEKTLGR